MALDMGLISTIIIIALVGMVIYMGWKMLFGAKKLNQPITKDLWQRLSNDQRISARNNKLPHGKWIETEGDSIHPPKKKYAKYYGSNDHPAVIDIWWRVKWYSPPRWTPMPKELVRNINGKVIKLLCNDLVKNGFIFRPTISRMFAESGRDEIYYHQMIHDHIHNLFRTQEIDDTMENVNYEKLYASMHKARPMGDLMQYKPELPITEEIEPMDVTEG